jgi:hypothetical protein
MSVFLIKTGIPTTFSENFPIKKYEFNILGADIKQQTDRHNLRIRYVFFHFVKNN